MPSGACAYQKISDKEFQNKYEIKDYYLKLFNERSEKLINTLFERKEELGLTDNETKIAIKFQIKRLRELLEREREFKIKAFEKYNTQSNGFFLVLKENQLKSTYLIANLEDGLLKYEINNKISKMNYSKSNCSKLNYLREEFEENKDRFYIKYKIKDKT